MKFLFTNTSRKDKQLNMRHKKVLNIISTINTQFTEYYYTNGGCFQFFRILKSIFPEAVAYSDCNHVITKIGDRFYDITGEVKIGKCIKIDSNNFTVKQMKENFSLVEKLDKELFSILKD